MLIMKVNFFYELNIFKSKKGGYIGEDINNTSWVFQPMTKTTIIFYYNCNYKFMLMTT